MGWYVQKKGAAVYGPVQWAQLQQWISTGRVNLTDHISEDQINWMLLADFKKNSHHAKEDTPLDESVPPVQHHTQPPKQESAAVDSPPSKQPAQNQRSEHENSEDMLKSEIESLQKENAGLKNQIQQLATQLESKAGRSDDDKLEQLQLENEQLQDQVDDLGTRLAKAESKAQVLPVNDLDADTPSQGEWSRLQKEKDQLEKEMLRWKQLYDEESNKSGEREQELREDISQLRKQELSARKEAENWKLECERRTKNYDMLKADLDQHFGSEHNNQDQGFSLFIAGILESYNDLSSQYDQLASRYEERCREEKRLLETQELLQQETQTRIRLAGEEAEREREAAQTAQHRYLELESTYQSLLRAYREINDRYVQLREKIDLILES